MTKQSDQATTMSHPQTLYPSLDEKVVPAIINNYASNWVHVTEFENSQKEDLQQDEQNERQKSVNSEGAPRQPPNYF